MIDNSFWNLNICFYKEYAQIVNGFHVYSSFKKKKKSVNNQIIIK